MQNSAKEKQSTVARLEGKQMLNDFENMLRNLVNDKMLMSYGDNQMVVNSILSIVNMIQSISSIMQSDRVNDMFTLNVSNKIMELEGIVTMYGSQRLMSRGIQSMGMQPGMNPFMGGQPMYNQPMYAPNMMYNANMPQMPQMPYPPQGYPQMPQQMPQMPQQPAPQAPMPQQQAAPAPAPAAAAAPPPVVNNAGEKPASGGGGAGGATFSFPGAGGDEKAAGRDYLLALLGEK